MKASIEKCDNKAVAGACGCALAAGLKTSLFTQNLRKLSFTFHSRLISETASPMMASEPSFLRKINLFPSVLFLSKYSTLDKNHFLTKRAVDIIGEYRREKTIPEPVPENSDNHIGGVSAASGFLRREQEMPVDSDGDGIENQDNQSARHLEQKYDRATKVETTDTKGFRTWKPPSEDSDRYAQKRNRRCGVAVLVVVM